MTVYYFTFFLTFVLCFMYDYIVSFRRVERTKELFSKALFFIRKILLFACPVPLILITIFRYGIGFDYFHTYVSDYKIYQQGGRIHSDFGCAFLYKISQAISNNPQVFFIITGFLTLACYYAAAQRFSKVACLPFLIFILDGSFFRSLSMVSQYFGIAFLLLSFALLNTGKVKRTNAIIAFILIFLAVSVHSSGIIVGLVLIVLFFLKDKLSIRFLIKISCFLPICVFLLKSVIVSILLPIIEKTRFSSYINSVFDGRSARSILLIELFFFIMYLILILKYKNNVGKYEAFGILFESLAVSCALLQNALPLMDRMAYYFAAFHILTFPRIVSLIKSPILKCLSVVSVCCFLATWLYLYPISGNYDNFQPYMSIFGNTIIEY